MEENDELPKFICNQCVDQIESITQYRNSCLNAQIMLEGCITSGTIKSSGKVYIKEAEEKGTGQINKKFQSQQTPVHTAASSGRARYQTIIYTTNKIVTIPNRKKKYFRAPNF